MAKYTAPNGEVLDLDSEYAQYAESLGWNKAGEPSGTVATSGTVAGEPTANAEGTVANEAEAYEGKERYMNDREGWLADEAAKDKAQRKQKDKDRLESARVMAAGTLPEWEYNMRRASSIPELKPFDRVIRDEEGNPVDLMGRERHADEEREQMRSFLERNKDGAKSAVDRLKGIDTTQNPLAQKTMLDLGRLPYWDATALRTLREGSGNYAKQQEEQEENRKMAEMTMMEHIQKASEMAKAGHKEEADAYMAKAKTFQANFQQGTDSKDANARQMYADLSAMIPGIVTDQRKKASDEASMAMPSTMMAGYHMLPQTGNAGFVYEKGIRPSKAMETMQQKMEAYLGKNDKLKNMLQAATKAGMSPDDFVTTVVAPYIQQKVYDECVKQNMPKNDLDWYMRNITGSIAGTLVDIAARDLESRQLNAASQQAYEQTGRLGWGTRLAGMGTNFIADLPLFSGFGKVAGYAVKPMLWGRASQLMVNGMPKLRAYATAAQEAQGTLLGYSMPVVTGGLSFSQYEGIRSALSQYQQNGEVSLGEVAVSSAKGFALGGMLGGTKILADALWMPSTLAGRFVKGAAEVNTEAAMFAGASMLEAMAKGEDPGSFGDNYIDNMQFVLMNKVHGFMEMRSRNIEAWNGYAASVNKYKAPENRLKMYNEMGWKNKLHIATMKPSSVQQRQEKLSSHYIDLFNAEGIEGRDMKEIVNSVTRKIYIEGANPTEILLNPRIPRKAINMVMQNVTGIPHSPLPSVLTTSPIEREDGKWIVQDRDIAGITNEEFIFNSQEAANDFSMARQKDMLKQRISVMEQNAMHGESTMAIGAAAENVADLTGQTKAEMVKLWCDAQINPSMLDETQREWYGRMVTLVQNYRGDRLDVAKMREETEKRYGLAKGDLERAIATDIDKLDEQTREAVLSYSKQLEDAISERSWRPEGDASGTVAASGTVVVGMSAMEGQQNTTTAEMRDVVPGMMVNYDGQRGVVDGNDGEWVYIHFENGESWKYRLDNMTKFLRTDAETGITTLEMTEADQTIYGRADKDGANYSGRKMVDNAMTAGGNGTSLREAQARLRVARERCVSLLGEQATRQLESDGELALNDNATPEEANVIRDYLTARDTVEGINERIDEAFAEEQRAADDTMRRMQPREGKITVMQEGGRYYVLRSHDGQFGRGKTVVRTPIEMSEDGRLLWDTFDPMKSETYKMRERDQMQQFDEAEVMDELTPQKRAMRQQMENTPEVGMDVMTADGQTAKLADHDELNDIWTLMRPDGTMEPMSGQDVKRMMDAMDEAPIRKEMEAASKPEGELSGNAQTGMAAGTSEGEPSGNAEEGQTAAHASLTIPEEGRRMGPVNVKGAVRAEDGKLDLEKSDAETVYNYLKETFGDKSEALKRQLEARLTNMDKEIEEERSAIAEEEKKVDAANDGDIMGWVQANEKLNERRLDLQEKEASREHWQQVSDILDFEMGDEAAKTGEEGALMIHANSEGETAGAKTQNKRAEKNRAAIDAIARRSGIVMKYINSVEDFRKYMLETGENPDNVDRMIRDNKWTDVNGFYYNGTVYVNTMAEKAMDWTFGHEVTHHLSRWTEGKFEAFRNAVVNTLGVDETRRRLISYRDRYKEARPNITDTDLLEEITGDFIADIMHNPRMLARFIRANSPGVVESLKAGNVKDAMVAIWNDFTSVLDAFRQLTDSAEQKKYSQIFDMWIDAYKQAGVEPEGDASGTVAAGAKMSLQDVKNAERVGRETISRMTKEGKWTDDNTTARLWELYPKFGIGRLPKDRQSFLKTNQTGTDKFKMRTLGPAEIDVERMSRYNEEIEPTLTNYRNALIDLRYDNTNVTDAARRMIDDVIQDLDYALNYYKQLAAGNMDVYRNDWDRPRYSLEGGKKRDWERKYNGIVDEIQNKSVPLQRLMTESHETGIRQLHNSIYHEGLKDYAERLKSILDGKIDPNYTLDRVVRNNSTHPLLRTEAEVFTGMSAETDGISEKKQPSGQRIRLTDEERSVVEQEYNRALAELDARNKRKQEITEKYNVAKDGSISLADLRRIVVDFGGNDAEAQKNLALFDKIVKTVGESRLRDLEIDDTIGGAVGGNFDLEDGAVKINPDILATESFGTRRGVPTVHELIHKAVTDMVSAYVTPFASKKGLSDEARDAIRTLNAIYKAVDNEFPKDEYGNRRVYGATNIQEMVAELANPAFRERLKGIKYDANNAKSKNLWETAKDAIKKILGLYKPDMKDTTLVDAEKALDTLLDNFNEELYDRSRNNDFAFLRNFLSTTWAGKLKDEAGVEANEVAEADGKRIKKDLEKGKLLWKYSEGTSDLSDSNQGLYNQAENKSESATEERVNPQSMGKGMQFDAEMQEGQQEIAGESTEMPSGRAKTGRISELDKEYLEAVKAGDMKKVQQMVNDAAKKAGYDSSNDYMGHWFNGSAPSKNGYYETKEERKQAFEDGDFEGEYSLGDYVDNGVDLNDLGWQLDNPAIAGRTASSRESINNINNAIRKGKGTITMYRAVDANIKEGMFRNGDWITPSRRYAEEHIEMQDWESGRVISQEVSFDDVWWDGNDINEWGYDDGKGYGYQNTENNRKLLDPVTYDEEGNVIPLSKRFDRKNASVKYSISDREAQQKSAELDEANNKFNEQLAKYTPENADNVILNLGMPSDILKKAGVEDKPMKLYGSKIAKKQKKHGFDVNDLRDLPRAMANPIAVFDNHNSEGNRSVLTELKTNDGNILIAVDLGKGSDIDFNIIASAFGKGESNVENWLKKGFATYIDNEKVQDYLHLAAPIAAASDNTELSTGAKVQPNNELSKFLGEKLYIRTDNFKNWFGDWQKDPENASKIVDEEGNPRVMFHRTNNDFNAFNKENIGSNTDYGAFGYGFYFGGREEDFKLYGNKVMRVFLDVKNPLVLDTTEKAASFRKKMKEGATGDMYANDSRKVATYTTDWLKQNGYDGVIYKTPYHEEVMVIDPTQIKSIHNNGEFSRKNPDIRYSLNEENPYDIVGQRRRELEKEGRMRPDGRPEGETPGTVADGVAKFALSDPFYSNAARGVQELKQQKASGEQWIAMLKNKGYLKEEEDKWSGLSDWLRSQKGSVSREDVMKYITENTVKVEEVKYDANAKKYGWEEPYEQEWYDELKKELENGSLGNVAIKNVHERMKEKYGEDFDKAFDVSSGVVNIRYASNGRDYENPDAVSKFTDKPINSTRIGYTTRGLKNKREIALIVPSVDPYKQNDEVHFGDAGNGRAVAWVRFGDTEVKDRAEVDRLEDALNEFEWQMSQKYGDDTYDNPELLDERIQGEDRTKWEALRAQLGEARKASDGSTKRVLVIDEIQSKRHQDGREMGYDSDRADSPTGKYEAAAKAMREYRNQLEEKYGRNFLSDELTDEEKAKYDQLYNAMQEASNYAPDSKSYSVPDAPFRKNWQELAMKRMMRLAAEEGYDMVAWTSGEQQSERYGIGTVVNRIEIEDNFGEDKPVTLYMKNGEDRLMVSPDGSIKDAEGRSLPFDVVGKNLSEVVGAELAKDILATEGSRTIENQDLNIGGEGMNGFYDHMLPRFVDKYGKKWGVKTHDVELPYLEKAGRTMHAVDVTDAMKESVMQGQAMFSLNGKKGEEEKTLAGMHNISEEKLKKVLKLGGFANPSTAVVDVDKTNMTSYGEISLLMPSSMVDRETGRNAGTWTADAWTPTYPTTEKVMSEKGWDAYFDDMRAVFEGREDMDLKARTRTLFESWLERGGDASDLSYWFMKETGKNPEKMTKNSGIDPEALETYKRLKGDGKTFAEMDEAERKEYLELLAKDSGDESVEAMLESFQRLKQKNQELLDNGKLTGFKAKMARDRIEYIDKYGVTYNAISDLKNRYDAAIRTDVDVDVHETMRAAREQVETSYKDEFDQWLEAKQKQYGIKEKIFTGYDKNGNRKYIPNTLENASRLMTAEGRNNSTNEGTIGSMIAAVAGKADSLDEIRAQKNKLGKSEDEHVAFKEKWSDVMWDIANSCYNRASDPWAGLYRLNEALGKKDPAAYLKREYGVTLSASEKAQIKEFIKEVRENFPAGYFETKFERPVMLNEFAAAVVPEGTSAEVVDALKAAGLDVRTYKKGDEADRHRVTIEASRKDGVRFSIDNPYDIVSQRRRDLEAERTKRNAMRLAEEQVNTNPTEAQKKAGNYRMGHVKVDGMDVTIENPKGSTRSGKDADGKEWSVKMNYTYGYIRGTEGVDGDHIDVYMNDAAEMGRGNVYVVDQIDQKTGTFDEHKVMYGFDSLDEAREAYLSQYEKGWKAGEITEVSREQFKEWLNSSHRKTKPFSEYKAVRDEVEYQDDLEGARYTHDGGAKFSIIRDKDEIERLNNEPYEEAYHAMQLMRLDDGKLYLLPPMAAVQDGKYVEGIPVSEDLKITPMWEKADENPDLAFRMTVGKKGVKIPNDAELEEKDGKLYYKGQEVRADENGEPKWYFVLKKGNTGDSGKKLTDLDHVAYDPYQHSGLNPVNDQFVTAYDRSHLVIVKVRVPKSEYTGKSKYKADKALLGVGKHPWTGGKLKTNKRREVVLSRYDMPVEIMSDEEVAAGFKKVLDDNHLTEVPFNIVTPSQREALVKMGVKIGEPTKDTAGKAAIPAYEEWLKGNGGGDDGGGKPKFSLSEDNPYDVVGARRRYLEEQRKRPTGNAAGTVTDSDTAAKFSIEPSKEWKDAMKEMAGDREAEEHMKMLEATNIEEVASEVLRGTKLMWSDEGEGEWRRKGLASEMGWKEGERRKFISMTATREHGGKTMREVGEMVEQACRDQNIPFDEADGNAGLNACLAVMGNCGSAKDVTHYIENNRIAEAQDMHETWKEQEEMYKQQFEAERDQHYMQQYGMTFDEYEEARKKMDEEAFGTAGNAAGTVARRGGIQNPTEEEVHRAKWYQNRLKRQATLINQLEKSIESYKQAWQREQSRANGETAKVRHYEEQQGSQQYATQVAQENAERMSTAYQQLVEVKKQLTDYIKEQLQSEWMPSVSKRELNKLMNTINRTNTPAQVEKALHDIEAVAAQGEVNYLKGRIERMLKMKTQDVNGKNMSVAKTVDERTRKIMEAVRGRAQDMRVTGLEDELDDLMRQRRELRGNISRMIDEGEDRTSQAIRNMEKEWKRLTKQIEDKEDEIKSARADRGMMNMDEIAEQMNVLNEKLEKSLDGSGPAWTDADTDEMIVLKTLQVMGADQASARSVAELNSVLKGLYQENESLRAKWREANAFEKKEIRRKINKNEEMIEANQAVRTAALKEQAENLNNTYAVLENIMQNGRNNLRQIVENEIMHKMDVLRNTFNCVRGKRIDLHAPELDPAKKASKRSTLREFFSMPLNNFYYMCKALSQGKRGEDGFIYKYFMHGKNGVMEAYNTYSRGMREQMQLLNEKAKELFGTDWRGLTKERLLGTDYWFHAAEESEKVYENTGIYLRKDYGLEEMSLSKGQAAYLYAVWKMDDGKLAMKDEGYTEETIKEIEDFIGPKYIELTDWLQEDFLVSSREKYNDRYKQIYNTSMARIPHYIHIDRTPSGVRNESDMAGNNASGERSMNTRNGHLINRKVNDIWIAHNNIFDVISKHIQEMEDMYAYSLVRRDMDYILSSQYFRNQLNMNNPGDFDRFKEAAEIALKVPSNEKKQKGDALWGWMSKRLAGAPIWMNPIPMLKQFESYIAYFGYSQSPMYLWFLGENTGKGLAMKNMSWCKSNLPSFRDRVNMGNMGDNRITEDLQISGRKMRKVENVISAIQASGTLGNKFIDATTVSIGAKAIYDYNMWRQRKAIDADITLTDDARKEKLAEAHRVAVMEADIYYNATQQSSHPAFVSPMQQSRSFVDRFLTLYKNSSLGFTRQGLLSIYDLIKTVKDYRKLTDNYIRDYMDDGLTESDAKIKAKKTLINGMKKSSIEALIFGALIKYAWDAMGHGILGFGSDDDDEVSTVKKAAQLSLYPVQGTPAENILTSFIGGHGMPKGMLYEEGESTIKAIGKIIDEDLSWPLINDILNKAAKLGVGMNLQKLSDMYTGITGLVKGGYYDVAGEAWIDFALMLGTSKVAGREELARTLEKKYGWSAEEFVKMKGLAEGYLEDGGGFMNRDFTDKKVKDIEKEWAEMHGKLNKKPSSVSKKAYKEEATLDDFLEDYRWAAKGKELGEAAKIPDFYDEDPDDRKELRADWKDEHEEEIAARKIWLYYDKKIEALMKSMELGADNSEKLQQIRKLRNEAEEMMEDPLNGLETINELEEDE